MELNDYQLKASSTISDSIRGKDVYFALGLTGESGEVSELIKKNLRDGVLDLEDLEKELGDVLWYVSQLALCHNLDLEGVAIRNLAKLQSRKERGKIKGSGDNR